MCSIKPIWVLDKRYEELYNVMLYFSCRYTTYFIFVVAVVNFSNLTANTIKGKKDINSTYNHTLLSPDHYV